MANEFFKEIFSFKAKPTLDLFKRNRRIQIDIYDIFIENY